MKYFVQLVFAISTQSSLDLNTVENND